MKTYQEGPMRLDEGRLSTFAGRYGAPRRYYLSSGTVHVLKVPQAPSRP